MTTIRSFRSRRNAEWWLKRETLLRTGQQRDPDSGGPLCTPAEIRQIRMDLRQR